MSSLETFKYWLQDHLDDLKAACPAPEGRALLNELYRRVTEYHERTINKVLQTGDVEVQRLLGQLDKIQEQLTHDIEHLEDTGEVIDKITTGVTVASRIAMLITARVS